MTPHLVVQALVAGLLIAIVFSAAPSSFDVIFATTVKYPNGTTGNVTLHVERSWSPVGVDRFYQLLTLPAGSYYNANGFFRVVPGFVVQFGINGNPKISKYWENRAIKDDPVVLSNVAGTMAYATGGPNTRTTQLYINFANNSFLDGQGFTPFAKVTNGYDLLLKINSQYGQTPDQNQIYNKGNAYLQQNFPSLDYLTLTQINTHEE